MSNVDDSVRDFIWSRILYFAFDVDVCRDTITVVEYGWQARLNLTRASISLVSKSFNVGNSLA